MAFLDNSGDIILDAVLTDTGRKRLAKGDGSFKIDKFALADDEIDYALYENGHVGAYIDTPHVGDSAYFDLNIMMTPILEAFTNNSSSMKSKLISLVRDNLWYLPELVLHVQDDPHKQYPSEKAHYIAVNKDTVTQWTDDDGGTNLLTGVLNAHEPLKTEHNIRVEQGINNEDISSTQSIDPGLKEDQYIIEMDNRFGVLIDIDGNPKGVSYIDDDNIASYYISSATDVAMFKNTDLIKAADDDTNTWSLKGARGSSIEFKVRASISLSTSERLFDELGALSTTAAPNSAGNYKYIDTNIRITGATTGASIDIPVRYVRKTT